MIHNIMIVLSLINFHWSLATSLSLSLMHTIILNFCERPNLMNIPVWPLHLLLSVVLIGSYYNTVHSKKRIVITTNTLSCLLPISKQVWCIVTDNWQDGMRMCNKIDYAWRYAIPSWLVMTFAYTSESATTNKLISNSDKSFFAVQHETWKGIPHLGHVIMHGQYSAR